ncbi:MAG: hypothetical protein HKN73_01080, partial [Gemmatimonadetes bacterium]|nr:hypothetical protein [Gemmatimonadota bacterium]
EPQPYEHEEEPRETAVRIGGSGTGIEDRPTPTRSRTPRSREPRSREGFHAEALSLGSRAPDASGTGGRGASSDEKQAQRPVTARREVFLRDQAKGPAQSQVRKVRSVFSGGEALRAAVVAREVLGRPLALREYGDEEMWSG